MTEVEVVAVRRSAAGTPRLDGVSVTFASARTTVVVGPPAGGKTALLRVVAGFDRPDSGSVRFDGCDETAAPPQHRRIGFVSVDHGLFPNLDVRDNVGFGLRGAGRSQAARTDVVAHLLQRLDLSAHADKQPHQLTAPQRVRAAIAQALAPGPRVLLLDDPFAHLESRRRDELAELVRAVQREWGVTCVLATSDALEALAIADRLVVLRAGRVEQAGPVREVYRSPTNGGAAEATGAVNQVPATREPGGTWRVLDRSVAAAQPEPSATGGQVALVRPEDLAVDVDGPARVVSAAFRGAMTRLTVDDPDIGRLIVDVGGRRADVIAAGDHVRVRLGTDVGPLRIVRRQHRT